MKQTFKRSASLLLAFVMVAGVFASVPFTALAVSIDYTEEDDDYYNLISKQDWELAPGVVESEIVLNNDAGLHRQVAHVVEVDLSNPYTKVIPSYKGMIPTPGNYGVEIMSKQAAYAEANGYGNVVAAMNLSLSWYDSAYYLARPELVGEPLGYMVLDGVVYKNSQGQTAGAQTCVVINFDEKDGVARPADMAKVEIRSTSSAITGWEEQVIPANFGFLVKDGVNQYSADNNPLNGAPRSFVGIKEDGTFVMVMNDGRQAPYSTGFTNYEMAEFMLSLGCVVAVNGDGGGSSAFLSQRPGEELAVNCAPSDGAERDTTHGILVISTAPATGEFVRATISAENDYYTPGSTVKFSAVGSDLVGTAADIPADAQWQLADASFGTIEDGVFVSNGKVGTVTAQIVYNGEVVGEESIEIVIPEKIEFTQSAIVVPFGKTAQLSILATINDGIHEVVIKDGDITMSLDNDALGVLDGTRFTFTAVAEENAPENLTATLTATLNHGEGLVTTVPFSVGKGSDIIYDFEDQDITGWSIFTNYGQYGPKGPNGKVTDDYGNYWYHGQNERGYISVVDSTNGQVRNGNYALKVECDFTQIYETGYHALNLMFPTIDCTDSLQVGFWLYIPYDARHAEMTIGATGIANGQFYEFNEGWHYIKAQAKNNMLYYINISIDDRAADSNYNNYNYITEGNIAGKFTFYIDDVTVDYSTAVEDRENPVFGDVELIGNDSNTALNGSLVTVADNTLSFEVKVADDNTLGNSTGLAADTAAAYIDGKKVDCTFKNGKISIANAVLSDGIHDIRFEIADNAGNSMWAGGTINVATGTDESSTIKVVPSDPTVVRPLIGSLYWMDVIATDIETIDKVELVFDLNNASSWELKGMETAAGFTASYSIQEDDNIATIIVERTGDVAATGEAKLLTFPVRTWVSTITEYEGYEDQTPATLVSRGIIWKQSIELYLENGIITYVDGYDAETTGTFNMADLVVDTELFFTNYVRKSVTGAQEWINEKKAAKVGFHEHTVTAMNDCEATCTTNGYTGRTHCEICGSVIDWGTIITADGHSYEDRDGVISCECGELFDGIYTDGKTYVDGVVIADGWNADNTAYYVDGVKLTGSYFMDGVMYTFDENGTYLPDYIYEGAYEVDDTIMYFINGQYLTGAQIVANDPYYFDENGLGYDGEFVICGETCVFDDGRYVSCSTADLLDAGWCGKSIEYVVCVDGLLKLGGTGNTYEYKNHGNRPFIDYLEQITKISVGNGVTYLDLNIFAFLLADEVAFEEGSALKNISTGAFHSMPYLKSIDIPASVTSIGSIAFKNCTALREINVPASVKSISSTAFKGCSSALVFYITEGSVAEQFAKANGFATSTDSFIKNGFVEIDGKLYYYVNGVKWTQRGLFTVDGGYYYATGDGSLLRNQTEWASITNDLLPKAQYTFDANGKIVLKNGFVEENGEIYYYVEGVKWTQRGVFQVGNDFYYAKADGALLRNCSEWASITNGLIEKAIYDFDENGKILIKNGFIEENGELYYYVAGVKWTQRGVFQVGDDFYYAKGDGALLRNCSEWASITNGLIEKAIYDFDENGKIVLKNGFIEENGELYYYVNGVKWTQRGVFQAGNDFYYAKGNGALLRNCEEWASITNGLLPKAKYRFDENGKIVI